MSKKILIALGGNAIKQSGEKGTFKEQSKNVNTAIESVFYLIEKNYQIILTHGNGPQVGDLLIQHETSKNKIPPLPMFMCGAQTQGSIGFLLQQSMQNHLNKKNLNKKVISLISQVEVDNKDPAFLKPTKPVGPYYQTEDELKTGKSKGFVYTYIKNKGFRRVVPSPLPKKIVELETIKDLIAKDTIVISSGGGGIPVIKKNGLYEGIDAVIDKDKTGELLASKIKADIFIILTDIEKVAINFNKKNQKDLLNLTVKETETYLKEGHFAAGSMLPKIEAALNFLKKGGKKVIITKINKLKEAINGKNGTTITNN
jgi:carbamate kinase